MSSESCEGDGLVRSFAPCWVDLKILGNDRFSRAGQAFGGDDEVDV